MSDMKTCRGPSCDRDFVARELCGAHYQQLKAGKPLAPLRKPKTLDESVEEFIPTISADRLTAGNITYRATTSQAVTLEAVKDSAISYDAKVTEEGFEKWLRAHDAEVLLDAAKAFRDPNPNAWTNSAAWALEGMANDRRFEL